jgi:hypothetical protein
MQIASSTYGAGGIRGIGVENYFTKMAYQQWKPLVIRRPGFRYTPSKLMVTKFLTNHENLFSLPQ